MKRDGMMAVGMLVLCCGIGLASNVVRERPLSWLREPMVAPAAAPNPTSAPGSGEAGAQIAVVKPGTIQIEAVIEHLSKGSAFFIDAREAHEVTSGHLRGAMWVPSSAMFDHIDQVTGMVGPADLVVVYCGGGDCEASHNVADALKRDYGYSQVVVYEKGWEEIEKNRGRFKDYIETGGMQ